MTIVLKDNFQGLVLQDDRVTDDNLAAKDAVAQPSVYSQLNPRPSLPSTDIYTHLTLKASHEQSEDGHLEIVTNRAGHPITEEAGFVWRDVDAGDSTAEYKGWDGYQAITGWAQMSCTDSVSEASDTNIIRLQSGNMLISGVTPPTAVGLQTTRLFHYNVDTSVYTMSTIDIIGTPLVGGAMPKGPGILQLPSGRVLYFTATADRTQVDAYYSDDEGATWDIYAMSTLKTPLVDHFGDTPAEIKRVRAAYSAGEVCLIIWYKESADTTWVDNTERLWDVAQFASDDLGQNFVYQGNMILNFTTDLFTFSVRYPKVLPQNGGGFWIGAYHKHKVSASRSHYWTKNIPTAFTPFIDEDETLVYNFAQQNVDLGTNNDYGGTWWVDEDGIYYGLFSDELSEASLTTGISYLLLRSLDNGVNWTEWDSWTLQSGDDEYHLYGFDADCSGGKTLVPTRWSEDAGAANNYADNSVAVLYLGGFSSHTLPAADVGTAGFYDDTDYIGLGNSNETTIQQGRCWMPIGLPDNMGWTASGAGGTAALTGDLTLTTVAATIYYRRNFVAQAASQVFCEFALRRVTGGNLGSDQLIFAMQLCDTATYQYAVHIRMSATGFTVRSVRAGGSTIGTITLDMTKHVHVRAIMNKGYIRTWYAYGTDELGHVREWIEGPDGAVGTTVGGAEAAFGDEIYWGHYGAGSATSDWSMVGYNFYPTKWGPRFTEDEGADAWDNYTDLHPRSYSPLPSLVYDRVKLSAQSGPTRLDELFEVIADYDYPISNLDPRLSPSPNQTWRGEDEAAVELVYTMDEGLGDGMMDNIPLCVMALNANIKAFTVDYWDGAAYQPLGTANAYDGWTGLKYVRAGNRYTVDTSQSVTAKNYLYYEQHAGDTFLFDDAERPARIEHNTEGAWHADGTSIAKAKLPRLIVDPDAVSGAAASGTGQIWRKNFGLVIPDLNPDDVVKLRISIASHKTADDYYEVGAFVVGSLTAFGQQYDNGWAIQDVYNSSVTERLNGQRKIRNNGPKRKIVTFSWTNTAVDLCQTQVTEPTPDYSYGKDGATDADKAKSIYASTKDVTRTVMGFIERAQQVKIPVLLLRNIPFVAIGVDSIQLTKTLDHVYGRITNDPQVDNVTGTELENELERLNTITIEEEV